MRRLQRTSLLLIVLLFAGYACDLSSLDLTGQNPMATSLAQTLLVILTASQAAVSSTPAAASATGSITSTPAAGPSSTPIPTLSLTATLTPPWTRTAEPISTPTPIVPSISVSVPTNCREGPGLPYDMVGALLVGEKAQVLAVDPTRMFWYIPNPNSRATIAGCGGSTPRSQAAPTCCPCTLRRLRLHPRSPRRPRRGSTSRSKAWSAVPAPGGCSFELRIPV